MVSRAQRGFSLIEMMVGLAISLAALMAVSQIMLAFTQQRATVTQTMATQSNGTMALYLIERDLSQAGYAMMYLQDCDRIHWTWNGTTFNVDPYSTVARPGTSNVALTTLPVRIYDGATGSDALDVQYGKPVSGAPVALISTGQAGTYGVPYNLSTVVGFADQDMIVADEPTPIGSVTNTCTLGQVSRDSSQPVGTSPIDTATVSVAHGTASLFNVASRPTGTTGWNLAVANSYLYNLGSLTSRRYTVAVTGGSWAAATGFRTALRVAEFPAYTASDLVDDIIFLKAQYGLDTNADGAVDQWVNGTTAIDNSAVRTVLAVRIGIVARSPLLEKSAVDASATVSVIPAAAGAACTMSDPATGQCGTCTASMEVKCTVPDRRYRYKVYSTTIPLRNVIWGR